MNAPWKFDCVSICRRELNEESSRGERCPPAPNTKMHFEWRGRQRRRRRRRRAAARGCALKDALHQREMVMIEQSRAEPSRSPFCRGESLMQPPASLSCGSRPRSNGSIQSGEAVGGVIFLCLKFFRLRVVWPTVQVFSII